MEVAATGEIGVMLYTRAFVTSADVGKDQVLLRTGWVRKGFCLKKIVKQLLAHHAAFVEVYLDTLLLLEEVGNIWI